LEDLVTAESSLFLKKFIAALFFSFLYINAIPSAELYNVLKLGLEIVFGRSRHSPFIDEHGGW